MVMYHNKWNDILVSTLNYVNCFRPTDSMDYLIKLHEHFMLISKC